MIFKEDVVFLIEEYTARFGYPPQCVRGAVFPRRHEWQSLVSALRESLDTGQPLSHHAAESRAA